MPQNCWLDFHLELLYRYLRRTPRLICTFLGPSQAQRARGNQKRRSLVGPEHARPKAEFPLLQPSFCCKCHLTVPDAV